MVKKHIMLSGLLVAGLMGVQVQANETVNQALQIAPSAVACFVASSVVWNSVQYFAGERPPHAGCPLAGYRAEKRIHTNSDWGVHGEPMNTERNESTARMVRVGSYSVGVRTPNDATTLTQTLLGTRPAVDGFTAKNVARDAVGGALVWYGFTRGYLGVPSCVSQQFVRK